ncbi:hypothetical protein GH733_010585 [Mirounga leonina]|nr:hypothetical protein GH733_010585 [Mirounga leonina]
MHRICRPCRVLGTFILVSQQARGVGIGPISQLAGYPVAPLGFISDCSHPAPVRLVFTARDWCSLIRGLWEGLVLPFLIRRTTAHPLSLLCLFQNVCKPAEETQRPPTLQEIKQKIDSYNTQENNCLGMKLSEDGTYTGFIKVHLKLRRPVTVPAGIRPQSIYDAIKEVNLAATTDKRTSFYLPLDAIKQLHISSTTTVSEVIQGLLKKFMVVDNPQKFALFKRIHKDGQVFFQKLSIADCPLYLRLLAGPDNDVLSFVLKENETGEVEWDAFSIPELQNFLTILEKEEQDKIQQVQKKYDKFRQKLEEALRESQGKPG